MTLQTKLLEGKSAAILVAAFGIFTRLVIFFSYEPYVGKDFNGYQETANFLLRWNVMHYEGVRPPGYPLLLLLCGMDFHVIWIVQSALGVAVAVMLYDTASLVTGGVKIPLLLGLFYSVSINMLFFEAIITSEALSTFIIVLLMWLTIRISRSDSKAGIAQFAVAGFLAGFAALTKPIFLFLAPLLLFFFVWQPKNEQRRSSFKRKAILSFALPVVILIVGWSLVNKATINYFGVTTLTGFNLSNHSGGFMELAPEEYSNIRDIYLEHRRENIERHGTHSMTIWGAISDMKAKTGLSYGELSSRMARLSMRLFAEHPLLYLKSVCKAWIDFWKVPIAWIPEKIKYKDLQGVLAIVWQLERYLLILANFLFLLISMWQAYLLGSRKTAVQGQVILMISTVLLGSILQALVEYGDNDRYSIPFQPLVLLVVMMMFSEMLGAVRTTSGVKTEGSSNSTFS